MSYALAQIIIIASSSEAEDAFWSQILVLVLLVALVGIGSLIKTRSNRLKQQQYCPDGIHRPHSWHQRQIKAIRKLKDKCLGIFLKTAQPETVTEEPAFDFGARQEQWKNEPAEKGRRDLGGGMELLELDFLLSIIEKTESDDENDVIMRKLSFNELLRRGQLIAADSNTLRIYATDEDGLYGKEIQCEAMKELAERTKLPSSYGFEPDESLQSSTVDRA